MFPYLEICFLGLTAFRKRYASRKVQRNFRGFPASRRRSLASCFYFFFFARFYLIFLLKGNFGLLLVWLCIFCRQSLVSQALANPAPPAACVPAVADPILPAPLTGSSCAISGSGGRATRTRYIRVCAFFFFVLVSYLYRFCVVLLFILGLLMFAVYRLWLNVGSCVEHKLVLPCVGSG